MREGDTPNLNATALNQMHEDIEKLKWAEKDRTKKEHHKDIYDAGYKAGKKACFKKQCKKKRKTCFKTKCLPNFVLWMMFGAIAGSFLCTFIYFLFKI